MNLAHLVDPSSAAIVVGGTLLATLLQCGASDCAAAIGAVARLGRRPFNPAAVRATLAPHVTAMRRDGILRVDAPHLGDAGIDDATAALVGRRSGDALIASHAAHRARRVEARECATRTLVHGADLAPVFGLAGTLLSLSQLAPAGITAAVLPQAIGMAVLTTLYGLVLANLLLAPLARAIDRSGQAEERARQQVIDWLGDQLTAALPEADTAVRPLRGSREAKRAPGRAAA